MTPKEIREKSETEKVGLKKELINELFHLKIKKATGQLEKKHRIAEVRRDLARLLTIDKEKKKGVA